MVPPILILQVSTLFLVRSLNQCLEPEDCFLFVSVLAAFVGADHSLSGGEVDCSYPGFHLIHILAALAAASEGIKYHLFSGSAEALTVQTISEKTGLLTSISVKP